MFKRLYGVLIAIGTVILIGTLGYVAIEGWSFFDALYMTIITIASVGYGETHELTMQGRMFTIILILCGCTTLVYGISILTAFIVEGELTDELRRRKMRNAIAGLENHYIVCGMSVTAKYIAEELSKTGRPFVVIDSDPEKIKLLNQSDFLNIQGNATHEAILESANVRKAAGLLTALHNDAENLLVVVTAKGLNPRIAIVAKAVDEESERKLRQVGADRVVMPDFIGGLRMASEMIRPSVVTFLDTMLRGKDVTVRIEEIRIPDRSGLTGKTLEASGVLDMEGVTVVALSDGGSCYCFNPPRSRILQHDDVIIAMGIVDHIQQLKARLAA
ncbi:MAG TPA: potassium channel protein [Desulfuromonadaceae bacterium]